MSPSFVRELFLGNPNFSSGTYPRLSRGRAQQLEPLLMALRRHQSVESAAELLAELDLLVQPASWPTLALTRVAQQLAVADASAALSWIAHLSLGVRLVKSFATEARFLELVREPRPLLGFALTEASPGSDVSQLMTYAEPVPGGYLISGVKNWVTNARWATRFLVFARTVPAQAGSKPRLSAFLIASGSGVSVTPVQSEVLPGAGVGDLRLDRVFVPESDRIGPPGKGFRMVMAGLAEARLLVGAAATGACLRAFNDTIARLNERRAFGRPVGNFPSVQDRVASMLADLLALESLVHGVAGSDVGRERPDPVERAVVRLAASRASGRVLDAARELSGAAAFVGSATAARRWTDTRALTLLDGSDLALESYIVLEGTREVRQRASALRETVDPFARLDVIGSKVFDKARARLQRAFARPAGGLSESNFRSFVVELGERVQEEFRDHGAEIVERQHVQRRLATIVSELGTWRALSDRVAGEVQTHGVVGSRRMAETAEIWIAGSEGRIRAQFEALTRNDDALRDRIAQRTYADGSYPFDIL